MNALRSITPIMLPEVVPNKIGDDPPVFEWVDPRNLLVEEKYQRNISQKSVTLIKRIVENFEWSKMKPPICVREEKGRLYVVDGQHTAIAAVTHGGIHKIPVMIVKSDTVESRAEAFLGHNRDRIAVTPMQIYFAALAAKDAVAMALDQACEKSGATVKKYTPPNGQFKVGETVAVNYLLKFTEKKGSYSASKLLKVLVDAKRAPIGTLELRAVETLLYSPEFTVRNILPYDLTTVVRTFHAQEWEQLAKNRMVEDDVKIPLWRAVMQLWLEHLAETAPNPKEKVAA